MSLEDRLKGKTRALVDQRMAEWGAAVRREIVSQQAQLVQSLDALLRSVTPASETDIDLAIREVLDSEPLSAPVPSAGPSAERLRASLAAIDKGVSLSEVLTCLVDEASQYIERVAVFIVRATSSVGWYARGFDQPDVIKQLSIPLGDDTVFRAVHSSGHSLRARITESPATAHALARLGGGPQGILAVPLIHRDKVAAILYCDTRDDEIPGADVAGIEMLVLFAGKVVDLLALAPAPRPGPSRPEVTQAQSPEEQKAHEEARRFARLLVSEIKLYNQQQVDEGRRNKDICARLREDIERSRRMYVDRVPAQVRDSTDYFQAELVRILADGDASALGDSSAAPR